MSQLTRGIVGSMVILTALSVGAFAPDAPFAPVVINEVAWAGAAGDASAEWIELHNPASHPISLNGWRLVSSDGSPRIDLYGTIAAHIAGNPMSGYFLLERGDDGTVPGIDADQIYEGALRDAGETLSLYDRYGNLLDTANGPTAAAWPAGTDARHATPYASMERVDYREADLPSNWVSSTAEHSADGGAPLVRGTPRAENSTFNLRPTPAFELIPDVPTPGIPALLDASISFDENNRILSYHWDFGDGSEAAGPRVEHAFPNPGEYWVTLTLVDEKGAEAALSRSVQAAFGSPPVADFSLVTRPPDQALRVGRTIRFQDESSDADGDITCWSWEFGDGTCAAEPSPAHTYDRYGEYVVLLRVVDRHGEASVQSRSVRIASRLPFAAIDWSPDRPTEAEAVRIDASASSDPDGEIVAYRWDFGDDGTVDEETTDPEVERTFEAGPVDVRLTVVDDAGDESPPHVVTIPVNHPPIAQFSVSSFAAAETESIRFTDCSHDEDGRITCLQWDFGDGTTASDAEPEHAYEADGPYTISLTATDDAGATHTTVAEIVIENLPPTAVATAEPSELSTGDPVTLDASMSVDPSPDGSIAQYEWDLDGDGSFEHAGSSPTLCHRYDDDGSYAVRVRVTDDDGAMTASDPILVRVANRPPRVRAITWMPTDPTDTEAVQLTATADDDDGQIVRWSWDFAEGVAVVGSGPTVRFPACGTFTLRVCAEDDDGAPSDTFSVDLTVRNTPPVAEIAVAAGEGLCIAFDGRGSVDPSPTGEIRHVAWDFGDGTSCPGRSDSCGDEDRWAPVHCYPAPGTYIVTLVVIDDQGAIGRTVRTIHVAE